MKKIIVLSTLMLIWNIVMGQSVSKQINDIKRSSKYLSAEATMESEAKAYEMASELLANEVSEYAKSQSGSGTVNAVIYKNVAGEAEKIKMKRGTMTRVFLYVKKNDIFSAENVGVIDVPSKTSSEKELVPQNLDAKVETVNHDSIDIENELISSMIDTLLVDTSFIDEDYNKLSAVLVNYKTWQQEVLFTLLGCSSVKQVLYYIDKFRAESRIKRDGIAGNCKNPEKCYWIIFDDNARVLTILSPGTDSRVNFATSEMDSLKNYSGKGAIWFILSI